MWVKGCDHEDMCMGMKCDGMCCNDPWCQGKSWGDKFRFPFCLCWDRLRRCWVNPHTGFCVDIKTLEL